MAVHHKPAQEGTKLLNMPINEALEILLFLMILAAILGAVFRERFVYVVFVMIILLLIYEGRQRRKEKNEIEKKFDEALMKKRKEVGL